MDGSRVLIEWWMNEKERYTVWKDMKWFDGCKVEWMERLRHWWVFYVVVDLTGGSVWKQFLGEGEGGSLWEQGAVCQTHTDLLHTDQEWVDLPSSSHITHITPSHIKPLSISLSPPSVLLNTASKGKRCPSLCVCASMCVCVCPLRCSLQDTGPNMDDRIQGCGRDDGVERSQCREQHQDQRWVWWWQRCVCLVKERVNFMKTCLHFTPKSKRKTTIKHKEN